MKIETAIALHIFWYTFYGQFEFLDHMIMWSLGLMNDHGEYGNPFKATITWQNDLIVVKKWVFLLTGSCWNILIGYYIRRQKRKPTPDCLDFLEPITLATVPEKEIQP